MATRTGIPGTKSGGTDSLSVAEFNDLPGGLIGYAVVTASQSSITGLVDLTNLTITITPGPSRMIRIEYALTANSGTANDEFQIRILKDGVQVDRLNWNVSAAGNNGSASAPFIDIGPTNASHTYKLQMGQSGGSSGTFSMQASSTQTARLYIFDDGPQF